MKVTINVPDYALKLQYAYEMDGKEYWVSLTLHDIVSVERDSKEEDRQTR